MELLIPILTTHPDWFERVDIIYDAEALTAQRTISLRTLAGNPMTDQEIHKVLESEVRVTALADRVIAVSESEQREFSSRGITHVDVLGHSLVVAPGETPFAARDGFLFVGAVHRDISPNADALIWFLSEIFPRIRKELGDVPFTIAASIGRDRLRNWPRRPSGSRVTWHLWKIYTGHRECSLRPRVTLRVSLIRCTRQPRPFPLSQHHSSRNSWAGPMLKWR